MINRFLVLFTLIFCTHISNAQDIQVEKFEQKTTSPAEALNMRKDNNGNPCALLIVKSLKEGIEFEGWVMGEVERSENEYKVYVAQGCKHLKLKHKDFQTTDVVFENWNIKALESGTIYVLKLKDGASEQIAYIYEQGWNLSVEDVSANVKPLIMIDANKGNPKAHIAMALITLHSEPEKAVVWLNKILATGDSTCIDEIPGKLQCYFADDVIRTGVKKVYYRDDKYDEKWYEIYTDACRLYVKAIIKGYKEAGDRLFATYTKSRGVPQYGQTVIKCCEDSILKGNMQACLCLGLIYQKGLGTKKDLLSAATCFKKLMGSELEEQAIICLCQVYGDRDFSSNKESLDYLQSQANGNQPEALFQIGRMYEEGRNCPRDITKAVEMYEKASLYTKGETINSSPWGYYTSSEGFREMKYCHTEASCHLARIYYDRKEYSEACKVLPNNIREYGKVPSILPTIIVEAEFLRAVMCYSHLYDAHGRGDWYDKEEAIRKLSSLAEQGCQDAIDFLKKEQLY